MITAILALPIEASKPAAVQRLRGIEVIDLDSHERADLLHSFIAAHPVVWDENVGE